MLRICFIFLLFFHALLFAKSPVWKVTHGESELYLCGTIHLLRQQDFPLPTAFDEAYDAASQLIFETDPEALNSPEIQQRFLQQLLYREQHSLRDILTPKTYMRLKQYWADNTLDLTLLDRAKPMMLMLVMLQHELNRQGTLQEGVDNHFYVKAQRDNKETAGLVGIDEHLALFSGITDGIEEEFMRSTLDDVEKLSTLFNTIILHWKNGDTDALYADLIDSMKEDAPRLYEALLRQRNHQWLGTITAYLETPKTEFVLVGAAHLLGDDGLIELLHAKGYRLEQLP